MSTEDSAPRDLLLRLGCNTWALGVRYAAWGQRAPAPESAVTPALLARHELAHARAWQAVLARRGTTLMLDDRTSRHAVPFLRRPFATWPDLLAANLLFDTTIGILLLAAWDSTDRALQHQARRMIPQASLHLNHALAWVHRLGGEGGPAARALETAILAIWDDALCWLGAPDDAGMLQLAAHGVLDATPEILRARVMRQIIPAAQSAGLALPAHPAPSGKAWRLARPLPWERWNPRRWELKGNPDHA
jgi:1,2-phenylacetyl-CoA epoxidase catalytic subunit